MGVAGAPCLVRVAGALSLRARADAMAWLWCSCCARGGRVKGAHGCQCRLILAPILPRMPITAHVITEDPFKFSSISFSDWFLSKGGTRMSIERMWDPITYALGFIDCDNISARCMLTMYSLFATKTEASLLLMLKGSPDVYLSGPIRKYITDKGGRFHLRWGCRDILYDESPDGDMFVTGLAMSKATSKQIVKALTTPEDYYSEGQGSLLHYFSPDN
ncbi:Zeta-carotene desaturase, chloroplastic/chromoplastic [Morella rubra]|uniref:Zeta-carotene desaturase, chloroplastic/chromoplastic n=1 Tax=Morella rubra TaxID=262757 RepID=A0A6A1UJS9_9ROSI|nr:Zeta-carotene desaturase, chloroplastic/chromoplastic [Morella rubra]